MCISGLPEGAWGSGFCPNLAVKIHNPFCHPSAHGINISTNLWLVTGMLMPPISFTCLSFKLKDTIY